MSAEIYALLQIGVIIFCNALLRFLPPFLFPAGRKEPAFITYLGKVLPYAIMGMLVIYCLKGVSVIRAPFGLPELISIALVVVLHLWRHNTLLSIFSGTVSYMLLVQFVF